MYLDHSLYPVISHLCKARKFLTTLLWGEASDQEWNLESYPLIIESMIYMRLFRNLLGEEHHLNR